MQDRIASLTENKRVNGKSFIPLYLGDKSQRKKILSKDDLEQNNNEEVEEHAGDNQYLMIDMMNQR